MKKQNENQSTKRPWWKQLSPLHVFLVFSMALAVTIVACKKNSSTTIPTDNTVRPPVFGLSMSTSLTSVLFDAVATGAAGVSANAGIGWAIGALGVCDGSPDFTTQFEKIEEDLNVIIGQLSELQVELIAIEAELNAINCSEWQSSHGVNTPISRIQSLMIEYEAMIATASNGARIPNSTIADWVDQVLAQGSYSSHSPMDEILDELAQAVYTPPSGGVIHACLSIISAPDDNSFGTDTIYYNTVKLYTDYYYFYQVQGLVLLSEAKHYKAWVVAGSPNSDSLSADSISYVCQVANAELYCNESAAGVNNLYNALIEQLTVGGAPYTDENIVLEYQTGQPWIWPLSLEDFTVAAGDNCIDPLTSEHPCGIAADLYNNENMESVTYKGYTGWKIASNDVHLKHLLAGWTSGTVGDYLENSLGFKNMNHKIVMGNHTYNIELAGAHKYYDFISFFDTDIDKSFGINQPTYSTDDYRKLAPRDDEYHAVSGHCAYYRCYYEGTGLPTSRNDFYDLLGKVFVYADGMLCESLKWYTRPGWLSHDGSTWYNTTKQYRWPIGPVFEFTCTEGRSQKNAGGIFTMCGDDFTAWFDHHVPRPATCDNAGAGVTCGLSAKTITKAKRIFSNTTQAPIDRSYY